MFSTSVLCHTGNKTVGCHLPNHIISVKNSSEQDWKCMAAESVLYTFDLHSDTMMDDFADAGPILIAAR